MSEALPPDSDLSFPQLLVVSASAGSGKTTALTKRYVQFLLSDRNQHRRPQNLLAITFTNNAAAEMKQRILGMLKGIALGDSETLEEIGRLVSCDPDVLRERAGRMLEDILDDYTAFQVRTIDSFLTSVFRSSAIDLGFSPAVELQLHPERLIRASFRTFAHNITSEEKDLEMFRQLVERADESRSDRTRYVWDPFNQLANRVVDLYFRIASLGRAVRIPETESEMEHISRMIQETAKKLGGAIEKSGLPPYAYLMKDLAAIERGDIRAVCGRSEKKWATNKPKTAKHKDAEATFGGQIAELLEQLNGFLGAYALLDARSYYVPYARTLRMMDTILEETKRRENIVLLDDMNAALRSYMVGNIVPEMYIKLGERIFHFLIDEFQDTSPSQWEALFPLLENALSEHGSLFVVGDTKQSIYSFRGADWRIMRRLMTQRVFASAEPMVRTLGTNYRSDPRLLDITREVFQEHTRSTDYQEAASATGLSSYALEPAPKASGGHYEIVHAQSDGDGEDVFTQVVSLLADAKKRGYAWSDMAVLAPKNATVIDVSSLLNAEGIPFISQSSLDIRNRPIIAELLACLRFLDAPVDDAAFASFVLGRIMSRHEPSLDMTTVRASFLAATEEGTGQPCYKVFQEKFPEVWSTHFESLFQHVGFLPLYDLVSSVIGTFSVLPAFPEEEASVIRFLECVREFEDQGNNAVRDFVKEAAEESEGLSWELPRPAGENAVTLMTIHKAKGLGFPVVVVLEYEWSNRGGRPALLEREDGVELLRLGPGHGRNNILREVKERTVLDSRADELNRLYVALTRARSELYVLVVTGDDEKPPARFLPPTASGTERPRISRPEQPEYPSLPRLLATAGRAQTVAPGSALKDREVKRGDLAHAVLATIDFLSDAELQVQKALAQLTVVEPVDDSSALADVITTFLSLDAVEEFFTEKVGRKVWCEKDVTDARGRLFRIDRLVVDPENVTIVDFKTGGRDPEELYKDQVRRYMEICRGIYPGRHIAGYIGYIDRRSVVEVR